MTTKCKLGHQHTKQPESYLEFVPWAEKMRKNFDQIKCKSCGLYLCWAPKNMQDTDK